MCYYLMVIHHVPTGRVGGGARLSCLRARSAGCDEAEAWAYPAVISADQ